MSKEDTSTQGPQGTAASRRKRPKVGPGGKESGPGEPAQEGLSRSHLEPPEQEAAPKAKRPRKKTQSKETVEEKGA